MSFVHDPTPGRKPIGSFGALNNAALQSAVGITVAAGTIEVDIQCTGASATVAFREDGTDPTTTVGFFLSTTDGIWTYRGAFADLRFIDAAATPVIYYQCFGL